MQRISVTSSNLASVGYNPESRTLEIGFRSGAVYQYSGVPVHIYKGLMAAGSHGKYFQMHIKNGYTCVEIS